MRSCLILLAAVPLLVLASSSAPKESTQSDVITCGSKPGDKMLSFMEVTDEGHHLGIASIDIVYPPDGEPERNVVNCITIKDMKPELGSTATITNGTIGDTKIAIHLESSFTKGLYFSIKLTGQPK